MYVSTTRLLQDQQAIGFWMVSPEKVFLDIAKDEGIKVDVRKFTVTEIVEASKNGSLKEMFGAGTAAVISPIATFGFKDTDYDLPELEKPDGHCD